MDRCLASLALALAIPGCALLAEPAPALPALSDFAITALSLSTACVDRGETFGIKVTAENRERQNGTAEVIVSARQHGHLVNERVRLDASATREMWFEGAIGSAGAWTVYAIAPKVSAGEASIRIVERGASC